MIDLVSWYIIINGLFFFCHYLAFVSAFKLWIFVFLDNWSCFCMNKSPSWWFTLMSSGRIFRKFAFKWLIYIQNYKILERPMRTFPNMGIPKIRGPRTASYSSGKRCQFLSVCPDLSSPEAPLLTRGFPPPHPRLTFLTRVSWDTKIK